MTLPTEIIPSDASTLFDTSKPADCLLLDCRTEEEYSIAKIAKIEAHSDAGNPGEAG